MACQASARHDVLAAPVRGTAFCKTCSVGLKLGSRHVFPSISDTAESVSPRFTLAPEMKSDVGVLFIFI